MIDDFTGGNIIFWSCKPNFKKLCRKFEWIKVLAQTLGNRSISVSRTTRPSCDYVWFPFTVAVDGVGVCTYRITVTQNLSQQPQILVCVYVISETLSYHLLLLYIVLYFPPLLFTYLFFSWCFPFSPRSSFPSSLSFCYS